MIQMDFLQNRNRITDIKNKLMVPKAGRNRINSEFGIKIYTLPSIKEITDKYLLYNTGYYTQYLIMRYNEKESKKKKYIYRESKAIQFYIHINMLFINF